MRWYYINIDFLWNYHENCAREIAHPAGKDKQKAIEEYNKTIAEKMRCIDDKSKPAKIDLTEYIYSRKTNKTRCVVLCKNY